MAVAAVKESLADEVTGVTGFLSQVAPFKGLGRDELARVAAVVSVQHVAAAEVVQVESGPPGEYLYVVHDGTLELVHKGVVIAIVFAGEVFGHPTLLTDLPPEFTARARVPSTLWRIPKDTAIEVLSRPEGVRFVADVSRERLIQAARTMSGLSDASSRPVGSLVRGAPVFCEARTTISAAARRMGRSSALLVRTAAGVGIVTDVDLREKVVAGKVSRDAPVDSIMSAPAESIAADETGSEAAIRMMAAGVNHLVVEDGAGLVVGVLSAEDLMSLNARSPFALRRRIQAARDVDSLADVSSDLPALFVDLLDTHIEAPALARVLTVLSDAMTVRLLELFFERHGRPPVPYAWLVFGSGARNELTIASDQDNGIAFADSKDPRVEDYFRELAETVNDGLARCGYAADPHGTVAQNWQWRLPLSLWESVFARSLQDKDLNRLARASVAFDFRQLAGDLAVAGSLTRIMREAPGHRRFMDGIARLATRNPLPLVGLRQRVADRVDIKRDCLRPIQNFARYHALEAGITAHSTLDRLTAAADSGALDRETEQSLRDAFTSMLHLQQRHHARAIRSDRPLDNIVEVDRLRPLTRATLQEALRLVAATQRHFPSL